MIREAIIATIIIVAVVLLLRGIFWVVQISRAVSRLIDCTEKLTILSGYHQQWVSSLHRIIDTSQTEASRKYVKDYKTLSGSMLEIIDQLHAIGLEGWEPHGNPIWVGESKRYVQLCCRVHKDEEPRADSEGTTRVIGAVEGK